MIHITPVLKVNPVCFYDEGDYDWYAQVVRETDRLADRPRKCMECGCLVPLGSPIHEVFQQEHELCQICEDDESEHFEDSPEPHDCVYGHTYLHRHCEACSKLLKAIEKHEADEGCPPHNRRPPLGELRNVFTEHSQNFEYAEVAVEMFPELWDHRFIRELVEEDA